MIDYFSLFLLFQCGVLVKRFYQEYKEAYPEDTTTVEENQNPPNFFQYKAEHDSRDDFDKEN